MDKTLNSNAAPTRPSTSDLNIHRKVGVDLRKTVEILRNSGVNVTVCIKEPPTTHPTVVGKGKAAQSKGKQSTIPHVLAKGNGKALTIDPPFDGKENAFTHDCPSNKRQKTMEKVKEKQKDDGDSNEVVNISRYAIGQQRRRERERLAGRIRPLPLSGLVPTKYAIAQRRRREIERTENDLQASAKQTTVDLVSSSTTDPETPDLIAQPNIHPPKLCDIIPTKNAIAMRRLREKKRKEIIEQSRRWEIEKNEITARNRQREIERNEILAQSRGREIEKRRREVERIEIIGQIRQREIERNEIIAQSRRRETERNEVTAQSRQREIERNGIDPQASSKQTDFDLVVSSTTDTETLDMTKQPNIHERIPSTTHGEQNNLQGLTQSSILGRILSPRDTGGELLNMELTENETVQVHPAIPPNVCLMQEENIFTSQPDLSTTDLSTAIFYHRQTYLQLFLILHLGMVTLGR